MGRPYVVLCHPTRERRHERFESGSLIPAPPGTPKQKARPKWFAVRSKTFAPITAKTEVRPDMIERIKERIVDTDDGQKTKH